MASGTTPVGINIQANSAQAISEINRLNAKLASLTGGTRSAGAGMNKMSSSSSNLKGKIIGLATSFVALRAAIGTIKKLITVNLEFEDTMQSVRAVTEQNTGFTIQAFRGMQEEARKLGAVTRFTASEAATGLKFLAMAGFTAEEATESLVHTLRLAQAGALDLGRAADIVSNIMTAFGADTSETQRFVDVLAKTAASANTNIEQLGQGMKFVAPLAAGLGISLEQTAGAMAILSNAGLQGSMAGTGARMMMVGLADESNKSYKALKKFGIGFEDLNPQVHSLTDILMKLKTSGFGVQDAFKAFGARGGAAAAVLIRNAEAVGDMTDRLSNAKGAAEQMANTMDDSLAGAFKRVKSAWEEFLLSVGDGGLGGLLREKAEAFIKFIQDINAAGTGVSIGQKIANGLDSAITMLKSLVGTINKLASVFGGFSRILKAMAALWILNKIKSTVFFSAAIAGAARSSAAITRYQRRVGTLPITFSNVAQRVKLSFVLMGKAVKRSFMSMAVAARTAAGMIKGAMAAATLGLTLFMDVFINLVTKVITGGHTMESAFAQLEEAQARLAATNSFKEWTEGIRESVKNLKDQKEIDEFIKSIEEKIASLGRLVVQMRLEGKGDDLINDIKFQIETAQRELSNIKIGIEFETPRLDKQTSESEKPKLADYDKEAQALRELHLLKRTLDKASDEAGSGIRSDAKYAVEREALARYRDQFAEWVKLRDAPAAEKAVMAEEAAASLDKDMSSFEGKKDALKILIDLKKEYTNKQGKFVLGSEEEVNAFIGKMKEAAAEKKRFQEGNDGADGDRAFTAEVWLANRITLMEKGALASMYANKQSEETKVALREEAIAQQKLVEAMEERLETAKKLHKTVSESMTESRLSGMDDKEEIEQRIKILGFTNEDDLTKRGLELQAKIDSTDISDEEEKKMKELTKLKNKFAEGGGTGENMSPQQLETMKKLQALQDDISGRGIDDTEAKQYEKILKTLQKIADLKRNIAGKDKKSEEGDAKKKAAKEIYDKEMKILALKAKGEKVTAENLRKQLDIEKRSLQLVTQLGMSKKDADIAAKNEVDNKAKLDAMGKEETASNSTVGPHAVSSLAAIGGGGNIFGGNSMKTPIDRTATATEKTATGVQNIVDRMNGGGIAKGAGVNSGTNVKSPHMGGGSKSASVSLGVLKDIKTILAGMAKGGNGGGIGMEATVS